MLNKSLKIKHTYLANGMYADLKENPTHYLLLINEQRGPADDKTTLSRINLVIKYSNIHPEMSLEAVAEMTKDYAWDFSEAPDLQAKYPCGASRWKEFHK